MEIRIVEDDDLIYSERNNSLYGFPRSKFGSLTPYTDEEDNPRDRCALLEKQIVFHDFKKLTIQDSEEEPINPNQEEDADYMDISSEDFKDDPMEIDEKKEKRKEKKLPKFFLKIIHYWDKNKKRDKCQRSVPTVAYQLKKEKRKKKKKRKEK